MKKNPSTARIKKPLPRLSVSGFLLLAMLVMPLAAHAQGGSPFDSGLTAMQTLFTGTIAKVTSLIAIVLGGYPRRTRRSSLLADDLPSVISAYAKADSRHAAFLPYLNRNSIALVYQCFRNLKDEFAYRFTGISQSHHLQQAGLSDSL